MSQSFGISAVQFLPITGIALTYGLAAGSWLGLGLGAVGLFMLAAGLVRLRRNENRG